MLLYQGYNPEEDITSSSS